MQLWTSFSRRAAALVVIVLVAGALVACQPTKQPVTGECTQYWRGYVLPGDHNYAGLGAFSGSDRYMCKEFVHQGVRAQMQHLRNYADETSVHNALGNPFEPRPKYDEAAFDTFVFKGAADNMWVGLNGKWAVPGTTYAQNFLGNICNPMRQYWGLAPWTAQQIETLPMLVSPPTSVSELTAEQIGAYIEYRDAQNSWYWKPEISPTEMAAIFINEGNAAGIRGDIAFCQSILETGWFAWPNSPDPNPPPSSTGAQSTDPVLQGYLELQQSTARN